MFCMHGGALDNAERTIRNDERRYCSRCHPGLFRRVNRTTVLQRTLLTWLGFFPWECVSCRRRKFFRDSGRKTNSSSAIRA